MVSWGKAFGTAVKIILMVIVWYIIGFGIAFLIIVIAGGMTTLAILAVPQILTNPLAFPSLASNSTIVYFLAFLTGAVISALGGMATILKYSAEFVASETIARMRLRASQQYPPVRMSLQSSKACATSGAQSSVTTKYCNNCGTKLQ
jgi:hypothetical protein